MRSDNKNLVFFIIGLIAGISGACGAASFFPYRYYGISMPKECYSQGKLLGKKGHKGWGDLPLSDCMPDTSGNNLRCLVALDGDFYAAKGDFLKCQEDLGACQKRCK